MTNGPNSFLVRGYHTPPGFMMPDYGNSKMKAAKFNESAQLFIGMLPV